MQLVPPFFFLHSLFNNGSLFFTEEYNAFFFSLRVSRVCFSVKGDTNQNHKSTVYVLIWGNDCSGIWDLFYCSDCFIVLVLDFSIDPWKFL